MNTEQMPPEIQGYIFRGTETADGKKGMSERQGLARLAKRMGELTGNVRVVILAALLATVILGGAGIASWALASESTESTKNHEMSEEKEQMQFAVGADNQDKTPSIGLLQTKAVAQSQETTEALPTTEALSQAEVLSQTEAAEPQETTETLPTAEEDSSENKDLFVIPSGEDFLTKLSKQEVTADYEQNLTGLLWNYELIADIRRRMESEGIEEDEFSDDDYRELLVLMGVDDSYASQNPELPAYLTRTYNPKMDVELTDDELATLLRLVEAEAPAEDIYGKILVANVVMNRVYAQGMANDVKGVIYEKIGGSAQFAPTVINWYWNSIVVTDSTREAVARCLSGEDYSDGALFFYAWADDPDKHLTTAWMKHLTHLFTHGGHRFFR